MAANLFPEQKKIIQVNKSAQWMRQLISISENAGLKFLMPSRRHHPQVEPLLATYKICHTKWWLNDFGAFKEHISLQKSVGS